MLAIHLRRHLLTLLTLCIFAGSADSAQDLASVTTDYLSTTSVLPLTGNGPTLPLTVACWEKPDDANGQESLWSHVYDAVGNDRLFMVIADTGTGDFTPGGLIKAGVDGGSMAESASAHTASVYNLAISVFAGDADRRNYLGATRGTDNTATDATGNQGVHNLMCFGRQCDSTPNWEFDGAIGPCGIWNVAFTDTDATNLFNSGSGANFDTVQGANLIACWDMNSATSTEPDLIGSRDLTINGSPSQVAGPSGVSCLSAASAAVQRRRQMQ